SISISVSSKHRQTKRFVDTLQSYLLEVRHMLRQTQRRAAASPARTRARENEEPAVDLTRPPLMTTGTKSRSGRAVETTRQPVRAKDGDESTSTTSREESDGEGGMLGGYGYFDSGSFKHLLNNEVH